MSLNVLTQGGGTGGASASIFVTGLSEADTVTATKDGKTVKGKWAQKPNPAYVGLPDGFTQLESIEGTGTQYFKTGLTTNDNYTIKCVVATKEVSGSLYGCTAGWSTNQCTLYENKFRFLWTSYYADWVPSIGSFYEIEHSPSSVKVNGNTLSRSADTNGNSGELMILNGKNGIGKAAYKSYQVIGTDGTTLLRDYVPAKRNSDGVIGLYDTVTNEFCGNAGTGEFVAGAEIPSYFDGHNIKIKEYGLWTVTATNGDDTTTQDVLVDAAIDYWVEMSYKLWLYRRGDECEGTTGGWGTPSTKTSVAWDYKNNYGSITKTKNADNLYVCAKKTSSAHALAYASFWTIDPISFEGYSKLCARGNVLTDGFGVLAHTSSPLATTVSTDMNYHTVSEYVSGVGDKELIVDISDLDGSYYCGVAEWWNSAGVATADAEVYEIWLEK